MKKIDLKAIKTRPHLIAKFPHLFQPGGGFPHLDQILDLTLVTVSITLRQIILMDCLHLILVPRYSVGYFNSAM